MRIFLTLLLALPLLLPTGFCPCHWIESADACDQAHDDAPIDRHDDSDCPCKSVDAGVRGFETYQLDTMSALVQAHAIFEQLAFTSVMQLHIDLESGLLFPSPPRYVVFLTLLV